MRGDALLLKWNAKDLESLQEVVRQWCMRRRSVVQAGGCLGVFAQYLAGEFQQVYTFEPDPAMFALLVANVSEPNVVKLQAALGHARGRMVSTECSLRENDGNTKLHGGMTRTESGGFLPTLKIDDLGLEDCDLIYLDVEGDEMYAIMGALETIRHCKPVLVCEINRGIDYRGINREVFASYICGLGYRHAATLRSDYVFVPAA